VGTAVAQPLQGRRILVTRPRGQAGGLRVQLEALGARVEVVPVIQVLPPRDPLPLQQAAERLDGYAWVVFTSRNGVEAMAAHLGRWKHALPPHTRVACIGPATAQAVRDRLGWPVHLQPQAYVAESLVEAFRTAGVEGARVLVARAEQARDTLPEGLRALGAQVEVVSAYRTEPAYNEAERLRDVLRQGVDLVTFASPSAVHAACVLCGDPQPLRAVPVACIGPVTAAAAHQAGLRVVAVAEVFTRQGLVEAVVRALTGGEGGG
jgi:uroporphyrinogen-III synthase